jgi:hypothetical protein
MINRTRLFLIGYLTPSIISSLFMWGDDRTSESFNSAPIWFPYFKIILQILSILVIFFPIVIRKNTSIILTILAFFLIAVTFLLNPILDAEFVLVDSTIVFAIFAIFVNHLLPKDFLIEKDIKFLFTFFAIGFTIQIGLYIFFGRLPSHTITGVLTRFNGLTNDSLATALILPLFIPWVVRSKYELLKCLSLIAMSILTGSLFAILFVPVMMIFYLFLKKHYKIFSITITIIVLSFFIFFDQISNLIGIKFLSIVTHLKYFFTIFGVDYYQSTKDCSEEFCESLIEAGIHLSYWYLFLVYAVLIFFVLRVRAIARSRKDLSIEADTLKIFGLGLIVATLVHPVPLIPFAIPFYLIFASQYIGNQSRSAARRLPIDPYNKIHAAQFAGTEYRPMS